MNYCGIPSFNHIEEKKDFLDGMFTIKNAISGGYFFLESILSVLPICDRIFVNDGGSTDGTLEALIKLKSIFPNKIHLLNIPDIPSDRWEVIDKVLNIILNITKSEWIIELQGDEIYHEKDVPHILDMLKEITSSSFIGIRNKRVDLVWDSQRPEYEMGTIRIFRNVPNIESSWGGDFFRFKGCGDTPRPGFTLHNLPPELDSNLPYIYHYPQAFSGNVIEKYRRMAEDIAPLDKSRINIYNNYKNLDGINCKKESSFLPALLRELVNKDRYEVREDVFDKEWLTKTTGIDYKCI